jgi:hypothetical protein
MSVTSVSLLESIKKRIAETTHGRIRNLAVEEVGGQVVLRGLAPSHHMRQLALQGALELIPGDCCSVHISVG